MQKKNYKKTPTAHDVLLTELLIATVQWCHMLPPLNGISIFSASQNDLKAKKFPIRWCKQPREMYLSPMGSVSLENPNTHGNTVWKVQPV